MTAYLASLKVRLAVWYDDHIVAGWYRSYALIAGWLAAGVAFAPDALQFIVDRWDLFGPIVMPKLSLEARVALFGIVTVFIQPPLRAWAQKKMQEAALIQAAKTGAVGSFIGSEKIIVAVEGREPLIVDPMSKGTGFEDTQ